MSDRQEVFSLEEGDAVLQWPARLSKASARDLQDWLGLISRKIKRAAAAPEGSGDATTLHPPAQFNASPRIGFRPTPADS